MKKGDHMIIYKIIKCENCGTIRTTSNKTFICPNCLIDSSVFPDMFNVLYVSLSKNDLLKEYRKNYYKQYLIDNYLNYGDEN